MCCCMIQSHRPASPKYSSGRVKELLKAHASIDKALKSLYKARHIINQYAITEDAEAIEIGLAIQTVTERGNRLYDLIIFTADVIYPAQVQEDDA